MKNEKTYCYFCENEVTEADFCYGCRKYICAVCDKGVDKTEAHDVEEHILDPELKEAVEEIV